MHLHAHAHATRRAKRVIFADCGARARSSHIRACVSASGPRVLPADDLMMRVCVCVPPSCHGQAQQCAARTRTPTKFVCANESGARSHMQLRTLRARYSWCSACAESTLEECGVACVIKSSICDVSYVRNARAHMYASHSHAYTHTLEHIALASEITHLLR